MDHAARLAGIDIDRTVPALLVKVGRYPIHHGGLGVMRTLGRLGVSVYALSDRRYTPAVWSRYLAGILPWSATGQEDLAELALALAEAGRRLGRRAVAIAGDDEAAVLLAEQAIVLREHFLLPTVPPGLPRRLSSKRGLFESCQEHGIPTPRVVFPSSVDDLVARARELTYPVVVKKVDTWSRLLMPDVPTTTIVTDERRLVARFGDAQVVGGLLLQEYIPQEHAEDWFAHLYADSGSQCLLNIGGRKLRSWPPAAGWTAFATAESNPTLQALVERLCKETGYQGIADVDVRHDRRDGQFKLVDFNPRVGAQFRIAENEAGIDVVRALHLDLTGRPVPLAAPRRRLFLVENLDYRARLAYRRRGLRVPAVPRDGTPTVRGWWAADDPRPFVLMAVRTAVGLVAALPVALRGRRHRAARG